MKNKIFHYYFYLSETKGMNDFMKQYSRQFIEEIVNHLDPKIISFFNVKKDVLHFPTTDLVELTSIALNEHFKGLTLKDELSPLITILKRVRSKKKSRWYNAFMRDIKLLNRDNPKYPLAHLITTIRTLSPELYEKLYGSKSLDKIINEEIKKVELWKKNIDSLFIEFPAINIQTDKTVYQVLVTDITLNAWKYISTELHGNINSYLLMYPDALVDKPLFGPSAITMVMQDTSENLLKEIIRDENDSPIMEIEVSAGKLVPTKSLESFDLKLLNTVIANLNLNTFYKDRSVTMDMTSLAHGIINYNPGSAIFEKIQYSCEKLARYNYTYISDSNRIYFNLFDHIHVDMDKKQATFAFGEILTNAIIQQKLIAIASPIYNILKNDLSSIICYAMKREQIMNQDTLTNEYNYVFFQKIVRFKSKSKKINIQLLKDSLQEFVDNQVIIESFKVSTIGVFTINFFKLSNAELTDLDMTDKEIIDV